MKKQQRSTNKDVQKFSRSKNKTNSKRKDVQKKNTKKNISIPQPLKKIVDAVVQPLKAIVKRHKKNDEVDVPFAESKSSGELTTSMKFFYTDDRFFETFDDKNLYAKVCYRWPALHEDQKNLQYKRSAILELLSDEEFMIELNDQYGMNAFDVISFLFRMCPSLFKGIFIKKVQNVVQKTDYAKKLKKHKYKIAKPPKAAFKRPRR